MRELDPGHLYRPDCYPAQEKNPPRQFHNTVQFRKRIGEGYPGNKGNPSDGTSTQELHRIVIARSQYVDGQDQHYANSLVIANAREAIGVLERRAAERRGRDYLSQWEQDLLEEREKGIPMELIAVCKICGHILCRKNHDEIRSKRYQDSR